MLTLFQVRGKPANEEHIDTVCSSSTALQLNVHIYMLSNHQSHGHQRHDHSGMYLTKDLQ